MNKNWLLAMICTTFASLVLVTTTNAQVVVFSNDFEDGDLEPEIGTATLVADSATPEVLPVVNAPDATLGNNVGLFDFSTADSAVPLDLTLGLRDTVSLADGNTVEIDMDVATRRSNNIDRTVFVDAMDSSGNIVVRLVLADNNAFGGGGADRQRPGFATSAGGNMAFGNPPASFWFGFGFTASGFDATRDAHMSLTISESSFDFSTTSQAGVDFSATDLGNYSGGTSANIAEVKITSFGIVYGMFFDNIVVEGVVADDPNFILGDVDQNGAVNFLDIAPFIAVLSSGGFQLEADVDENGGVNFLDIAPFIAALNGTL